MAMIKEIEAIAGELRRLADELTALIAEPEAGLPQHAKSEEEPTLTLEELRAFVAERSSMENRPKIKAILTRFGVSKLTELPTTQYAALQKEVAAL
ncbi:MAG: hypothetical protein VB099_10760 [Candidatus Limiplasma sp.]|nr:hypothetical protein [Candidatus Limiplasma sp.]